MAKLYVVFGLSGAGKDTVYELLRDELGSENCVNVKFSGLMKCTFEEWYGVPAGSFDDREFRERFVPGRNVTYLDVMVKAYHAWDEIDPALTVRPTERLIRQHLESGVNVVVTDCRKHTEAESLVAVGYEYGVEVVYVYGRVGEMRKSSDMLMEELRDRVVCVTDIQTHLELVNTGDIRHLIKQMKTEGLI